MTIGEVTTLDSGSDATASITGTSEDPVLNLGIPQGQEGKQGPKGDSNPTGTILLFERTRRLFIVSRTRSK